MRSNTLRTAAFLVAGLVAGVGIATWLQPGSPEPFAAASSSDEPLASRVAALERRVLQEAIQRETLAAEVDRLRERLELGGDAAGAVPAWSDGAAPFRAGLRSEDGGEERGDVDGTAEELRVRVRSRPRSQADIEQMRIDRFVRAGFTAERAAWIDRRTEELRMQALEAQYQAARGGEDFDARSVPSADEVLRSELGDAEYERYLQALGRPTRIGVRSVLASSPAEVAGLLPGDEIVAYAGERVFDVDDLNRLTYEGRPGEPVALDVIRDGQPIQVYVPRGPVGITGGGRSGRRP